MDSVTVSKQFEGSPQAMAERCHTLDSRKAWPGAQPLGGGGATLYWQVSMRLKAAAMTDVDIEEKQTPITEDADGTVRFTTKQKVTYPDGGTSAESDYVFTPDGTVTFTYRYDTPSTKLVKPKALPAFHEGMQKVVDRFIGKLATPVSA